MQYWLPSLLLTTAFCSSNWHNEHSNDAIMTDREESNRVYSQESSAELANQIVTEFLNFGHLHSQMVVKRFRDIKIDQFFQLYTKYPQKFPSFRSLDDMKSQLNFRLLLLQQTPASDNEAFELNSEWYFDFTNRFEPDRQGFLLVSSLFPEAFTKRYTQMLTETADQYERWFARQSSPDEVWKKFLDDQIRFKTMATIYKPESFLKTLSYIFNKKYKSTIIKQCMNQESKDIVRVIVLLAATVAPKKSLPLITLDDFRSHQQRSTMPIVGQHGVDLFSILPGEILQIVLNHSLHDDLFDTLLVLP